MAKQEPVGPRAVITVCKNTIAANNKRGWKNPMPAIRVGRTKGGEAIAHAHEVHITDREGNIVASVISTTDGQQVVRCGAKVAIVTEYPVLIGET